MINHCYYGWWNVVSKIYSHGLSIVLSLIFQVYACTIGWNINSLCGNCPSGYHSQIAQEWSFSNGKVLGLIPDSGNILTCLFTYNSAFSPWFSDVNWSLNVVLNQIWVNRKLKKKKKTLSKGNFIKRCQHSSFQKK